MHNLVPQFIIERFKNGERYGELQATGVFVDLSGFSAMTDTLMQLGQHGAEILASIMREIFDPMIESVYQHGGFVATFAGDSFTAVFPVDREFIDSYKNPLAAATEIQNKIAAISHQHTPKGEFIISVRVGIATGTVNWGIIHDEERASFFFRGSAIEGCIRSEKNAESGAIILDKETFEILKDVIDTKPVLDHYQLIALKEAIPVGKPVEPPSVNLDTASRFYPRSIITQKQSGEFRQIVNMFISLPTVRTESQLEIFMQALFNLQNRYGGLINRLDFGDKGSHLLLFWGVPIAYENDIGRALNFILELQTTTAIPIKAGITYRIAHAGFIGSPLREEYTCYGQGVNLAARFMEGAGRGAVWVDDPIARRVEHYFDMEFEGEFQFKGFEQKQKVYSLYERRQQIETIFQGPFRNREKELETLTKISSSVWRGESAKPVIIFGDPGIGKSRLIHEFQHAEFMLDKDFLWVRCQTDLVLRNSFNPFRYWCKNYFEISDLQSEPRNKRNFNKILERLISATEDPLLASELDRTRSFLGSLVNLFWNDSLFEQLDPQGRYENTIIGLVSLIQAESKRQPVIIHIEDIQWLDDDSKELLNQLCRSIKADEENKYPLLILATSRAQPDKNSLGAGIDFTPLEVGPLSPQVILKLALALLEKPPDEQFSETLTNLVEGNPFFAEQIILFLKKENLLVETQAGWGLEKINASLLPTDIRALLVARLDQTEPEVKKAILTASTLGREFSVALLERMLESTTNLGSILSKAEQASVWITRNGIDYLFKSILLRDAAYRMQTHAQRQEIHADAVRALETLNQDDLSIAYEQLAYHAEYASLLDKAILYSKGAGINAQETFQNKQAIQFFTKAVDLSTERSDPEFIELLLLRVESYSQIGNREAQLADLNLAKKIATSLEEPLLQAKVFNQLAIYHQVMGEYAQSIDYARLAVDIADQFSFSEIEVDSRNTWSESSRKQGEYLTSVHQADQGLSLSQKIDYRYGICLSLNNLSITANEQGEFTRALEYLEQSLEIIRQTDNLSLTLEAQTLNNLANIYGDLGDFSSAHQAYLQALKIAQQIGTRMGEGLVTTNLGWVSGLLGDFKSARHYLERSMKIAKEIGDIYNQAFALINLSLIATCQKETEVAKAYAQQGLALTREVGHKPGEAIAATYLGHAIMDSGRLDQARESYQHARNLRNELGQQNFAMEPLAGIAEIDHREKGPEAALDNVLKILDFLDGGGTLDGIDQPFRIYATCARILRAANHPRAERFIEDAYNLLQSQAEKIQDARSRESFLSNVPFHSEIIRLQKQPE